MPAFLDLFNSFLIFLCTILLAYILYLDPITTFSTAARLNKMPLIINRRGGTRLPNRRFPVAPPIPEPNHQDQEQSKTPKAEAEAEASGSGDAAENEEFEAGPKDVRDVRLILEKAGKFPPEVADIIIDYAEYWASSTSIVDYHSQQGGHLKIRGGHPNEDRFLVSLFSLFFQHQREWMDD